MLFRSAIAVITILIVSLEGYKCSLILKPSRIKSFLKVVIVIEPLNKLSNRNNIGRLAFLKVIINGNFHSRSLASVEMRFNSIEEVEIGTLLISFGYTEPFIVDYNSFLFLELLLNTFLLIILLKLIIFNENLII